MSLLFETAAVIIPVFNEGERVFAVADAALSSHGTKEVIVVNDGSTDNTDALLKTRDDITVLTQARNMGKGEAMDTGMHLVRDRGYDGAIFLDGDLQGIKSSHVDQLLEPLKSADSYMSIGYLGLRKAVIKKAILNRWGALSGQRAIRTEVWDLLNNQDKHRFNIEAALNARLRKHGLHHTIARVALEGVGHVGKHAKEGNWSRALWAYTKTYAAAYATYARIELERKK